MELPISLRRDCSNANKLTMPERRLRSDDALYRLAELFVQRGVPVHIRSDNGPEFEAKSVRHWLQRVGVQTLFITPGCP